MFCLCCRAAYPILYYIFVDRDCSDLLESRSVVSVANESQARSYFELPRRIFIREVNEPYQSIQIILNKKEYSYRWRQWSYTDNELPSEFEAFPTYHFPMVNDETRNAAYYAALRKLVTHESVVVDLGAGSMLLTMMAKKLGAKQVFAIERRDQLVEIGKEILEYNYFWEPEGITIIHAESFDVELEDLGMQPDILVSETIDGWIIGEGFISSLIDLRNRGIIAENTSVIPNGGELFMQLVETVYSFKSHGLVSGFSYEPMRKVKPFTTMYAIQRCTTNIELIL